jgi:hypothetical protein
LIELGNEKSDILVDNQDIDLDVLRIVQEEDLEEGFHHRSLVEI